MPAEEFEPRTVVRDRVIDCIRISLSTQSFLRQAQDPEQGRGAALSTSWCYGYDNANRLTSLTHIKTPTTIESLTYTYDAAGNRAQLTRANAAATLLPTAIASTNLAYDAANEQTRFNSATTNLSYDNNGNLTSFTDGGGTTTYTWNVRNQLTAISGPSLSASFAYDGLGRRSSKTVNGTTTGFWYDGDDVLTELNGSTPTATYVRSLGIDEPFIRKLSGGDEFYQMDALGTSLVLTDGTGAAGTTYTQEPFGKTTKNGPSTNSFQFTGREEDGTGLYYYRARYFSPMLQRFLSEDPLGLTGEDVNFYSYVRNRPISLLDPLGLKVVYNDVVLGNPLVVANLERLNEAIVAQGIPDDKFELYVTGGDRYINTDDNTIRSLTDNSVIKDSSGKSPHLRDFGSRAVDIRNIEATGLTYAVLDKALKKTDLRRCKPPKCSYQDKHTHLELPNQKNFYYQP